ncbi:TetR/AcrR family transcriptional regulator [Microterricola viridarii]|uniref:DNA-binding transcriptional regulator, AcrR family n=1 Tax=Microterricola viridarii TaxID=412690 RepID=A0A1H1YWS0_9MICO|nr:TetR/AcrR family transcriptional regulator [Microterricola viridarii]SDT25891.1 DNA-binding transcriptional regulator, AcrR family [Microterricola viridarii]
MTDNGVVSGRGPAGERVLVAASRLFYERGITATGIDTITAAAGVAKMSLYNNFSSKEDLVLAYIQARHEEWLELYRLRAESARTPVEQVLAVFDAYIDHARFEYERGFRGCGLLNAAAELPVGAPGRAEVRRHKEQVEAILADQLAPLARASEVPTLAEHLSFLLEGSMIRAGLEGGVGRLEHARALASRLLGTP